jgi:hypothetical protein
MLIIADEEAFRVRGERGFARSAESEEKRRVQGVLVGCRRAMHREHAAFRSKVIHYCKHTLFHLTGVFGAENDELLIFKTQVNTRLRTHARCQPVRRECAGIVDNKFGRAEVLQLLLGRTD